VPKGRGVARLSRTIAHEAPSAVRIGRAPSTTHAEITHIGLRLFIDRGFDHVTVDEISAACGIGRRTFFRYFPSKNDLPWGQFDQMLEGLEAHFRAIDPEVPLADALRVAIVAFNHVPDHELAFHRQRMELLLNVPTLVAHSTLRYAAWRQVVAEFVAERTGHLPTDHAPQSLGWICLGIALAAYEQWLRDETASLADLINEGFATATDTLAVGSP